MKFTRKAAQIYSRYFLFVASVLQLHFLKFFWFLKWSKSSYFTERQYRQVLDGFAFLSKIFVLKSDLDIQSEPFLRFALGRTKSFHIPFSVTQPSTIIIDKKKHISIPPSSILQSCRFFTCLESSTCLHRRETFDSKKNLSKSARLILRTHERQHNTKMMKC